MSVSPVSIPATDKITVRNGDFIQQDTPFQPKIRIFTMKKTVNCYMEEYDLPTGQLGVRLREKESGRKVVIESQSPQDKVHFLNFLNAMGANKPMWPAILSKDDLSDSIVVSGKVKKSTTSTITFRYDEDLSYLIQ